MHPLLLSLLEPLLLSLALFHHYCYFCFACCTFECSSGCCCVLRHLMISCRSYSTRYLSFRTLMFLAYTEFVLLSPKILESGYVFIEFWLFHEGNWKCSTNLSNVFNSLFLVFYFSLQGYLHIFQLHNYFVQWRDSDDWNQVKWGPEVMIGLTRLLNIKLWFYSVQANFQFGVAVFPAHLWSKVFWTAFVPDLKPAGLAIKTFCGLRPSCLRDLIHWCKLEYYNASMNCIYEIIMKFAFELFQSSSLTLFA